MPDSVWKGSSQRWGQTLENQLAYFNFSGAFTLIEVEKMLQANTREGSPVKGGGTKTDEILEKFQVAFDPPPTFSETYIAIF